MIIDRILDRFDNEQDGIFDYNAHNFYFDVLEYGRIGDNITRAMDGGTEEDTQNALCEYITRNDYNPKICDFIRARVWNENTNEKRPLITIL